MAGDLDGPHPVRGRWSYLQGCRCAPCRQANADYHRWYMGGTLAAYLKPYAARWTRPQRKG